MSDTPAKIHPHDVGLPAPEVRKRHRYRHIAHGMLVTAVITAIPGWILYGRSVDQALRAKPDSPLIVLLAWALLLISGSSLVIGLWYLLLAQVRRIALMVGEDELPIDAPGHAPALRCPNCGWTRDDPDRFCRHCGKPLEKSPA